MDNLKQSQEEIIRATIFRDLHLLNDAKNFRNWSFGLIKPYVGKRILEIGSGTGNYTTLFSDYELLIPSDYEKQSIDYLSEIFKDNDKVLPQIIDANLLSVSVDDLKKHNLDTVVMLNVLEHVGDDTACLRISREIITDNGNIILIVPAHKFLFSKIDLLYGHHRRYSIQSIQSLTQKTGLQIKAIKYFNAFSALGWFVNMKLLGKTQLPEKQTRLFDKLVPILRFVENIITVPFGLSLMVVLNKGNFQKENL